MDLTTWIRSQAASGLPLNLHAVQRARPDLLEMAFGGPSPRGWRRCLIDAGVDPYKIVHAHEEKVECAVCGLSYMAMGRHLQTRHEMTGDEYRKEFGPEREISSESFRASKFEGRPIAGIAHWERLWSRHYVTDWILRLHEEGHALNVYHYEHMGKSLVSNGSLFFGSWDAALQSAGLNPEEFRAIPPNLRWTKSMVIESLRNFARLRQEKKKREMSIPLRMAIRRFFRTPQAACKAAGITYEEINPRAIFVGEQVTKLVAAIRSLENLKGRERCQRLDAIYNKNQLNQRIVIGHYGSLRRLVAKEGIAPRVVSAAKYRDEADVLHDLDLLEKQGLALTFSTLKNGHRRLYNVIRETGWGVDRLGPPQRAPLKFPPCNPRSGLLRDRMIILRRRLRISRAEAADMAGISLACWDDTEHGQTTPKASTVEKIERLLVEHKIPISTMPHTQAW